MAITIRDVARNAGVSTATVSRALRGLPNVDEKTRARVKQVAASLDYVISPSASRLASGRAGSIAVITPHVGGWYFSTVLSGVERELQEADIDLLLLSVGDHATAEPRRAAALRLRRRVDGVIAIALPPMDHQLQEVLELGMPTSLIGVRIQGTPSVRIDDVGAARTATRHLINLGHTRIGIIGGEPTGPRFTAPHDRHLGFVEAMTEAGVPIDPSLEAFGHFTMIGGERAMTALLTQRVRPSAVFAMSDEMAFGALRALRSHGLQPGRDVSVIGVDGHEMAELVDLTTVAQPVRELGQLAAVSLLAQIEQQVVGTSADTCLPTQLIVRSSTASTADLPAG